MSSECLNVCPLSMMVLWRGVWLHDWAPALVLALTLFFKMTSEGGTFLHMHHSLIKSCSLPQINGAESWLCRAVHHVFLTACCSFCLSMIHPSRVYAFMENVFCCFQNEKHLLFTSRRMICLSSFHVVVDKTTWLVNLPTILMVATTMLVL